MQVQVSEVDMEANMVDVEGVKVNMQDGEADHAGEATGRPCRPRSGLGTGWPCKPGSGPQTGRPAKGWGSHAG